MLEIFLVVKNPALTGLQYQFDDDLEFHNPKEPSTTTCPFLPGQLVNVLEVPFQVAQHTWDTQGHSDSAPSVPFTLDPDDKYRTPKPPSPAEVETSPSSTPKEKFRFRGRGRRAPRSELEQLSTSMPIEHSESAVQGADPSACNDADYCTAPPTRARSLRRSSSRKLRHWASVVSRLPSRKSMKSYMTSSPVEPVPPLPRPNSARGIMSWETTARSRANTSRSDQSDCLPRKSHSGHACFSDDEDFVGDAVSEFPIPPRPAPLPPTTIEEAVTEPPMPLRPAPLPPMAIRSDAITADEASAEIEKSLPDQGTGILADITDHAMSNGEVLHVPSDDYADASGNGPEQALDDTQPDLDAEEHEEQAFPPSCSLQKASCNLHHSASVASSRTSGVFSSVVDSTTIYTGYRTPWRLSEPLTPTISNFGDFTFEETPASPNRSDEDNEDSYVDASGFYGYSLPEAEHASVLTLRNLESANSKSSGGEMSHFKPEHRDEIIRAWNDGAEHHKSAMQELVDDFDYLSKMIA